MMPNREHERRLREDWPGTPRWLARAVDCTTTRILPFLFLVLFALLGLSLAALAVILIVGLWSHL